MVITFWAGTYKTKEELQILIDALDNSLYEMRRRVDCFTKDGCKDCIAKSACKDVNRLLNHLEAVSESL